MTGVPACIASLGLAQEGLAEPKVALERLEGLVVLDEVQRKPELFPLLRVLAHRKPVKARFLLTGSASPSLVRGVSESLAGRVALVDVSGGSVWRKWARANGGSYGDGADWEGLSTHFTKEFEAFALLLMREMPMSRVGELVGETDTRLWRMLFRQVNAAYAEADFSSVCCVGVDERSVRKGHEYISVFADLVCKRVLIATEGKDSQTWRTA